MRSFTLSTLLILALLLTAAPASAARRNDPNVQLSFRPQEAVAPASATIPSHLRRQPVALRVVDGRPGDDPAAIGTRTDDDDRLVELRATVDVASFVEDVARRLARDWGLEVESETALSLAIELLTFEVVETNQAVGATFNATVHLEGSLRRGAEQLWSGTASGDATRYGKKFSNENCNEVLSDALKESLAELLSLSSLHRAWDGGGAGKAAARPAAEPTPAPDSTTAAGRSISPPALLEELRALLTQDFDETTLAQYVGGKTLSTPMSAEDLAHWKRAGIPEQVIRTAMSRPVE